MDEAADVPTWLMTLIALVFFGGLGVAAFFLLEGRRRGLQALARRRGMTFHEADRRGPALPREFLDEVERGLIVGSNVRYALTGEIAGARIAVCELLRYRARSQGGRKGHYSLSVAMIEPARELPAFRLEPRAWRHALRNADGEIRFGDSPEFTKRYRLTGSDEAPLRDLFGPELRRFFEARPGRRVRAYGPALVFYRPVGLLRWSAFRPRTVERLLEEAEALARLLENT
jgi:uncharacterized membrane protein